MGKNIQLLDCTLRDGAYIVNGDFGVPAMKGIIKKMQDANVDIIECGWLKDAPYKQGSTYFHVPSDLEAYLSEKNADAIYTVMIDWNRYNLDTLPDCDGKSVDAIRIVFPKEHFQEGITLGNTIRQKGYCVFFQAANTLAYTDDELCRLADEVNRVHPDALSIVDTFGAMYEEDLSRILSILDNNLDKDIMLGFHSHNNQQLSFALTMHFIKMLYGKRQIVVDSSLCGMGRGAGNTTTELLSNYLNRQYRCNYDMNTILDAIDMYMGDFKTRFSWGYSTPYFIAGMYCTHVNNIAYLLENHRTNAKDMRIILESLSASDRQKYDYDLLENKYLEYQNKLVDDEKELAVLKGKLQERTVLLLSPGKSLVTQENKIQDYIVLNNPVVIGVNTVCQGYSCDYLFFSNKIRYQYAKEIYGDLFEKTLKILTSNIKTTGKEKEFIVNFSLLIKRGWEHFDNSTILCLRLLNRLHVKSVALAGFDGFSNEYAESYSDISLPNLNPKNEWQELNQETTEMFCDFRDMTTESMKINFVTESKFNI